FPPQWTPSGDGRDFLKVATSVGVLWLPRQVLWDPARKHHLLPGNAWLPEHGGMLITRRLQEWSCLLGIDFSFPIAQRLLGWQAGEEKLLPQGGAAVGRAPRPGVAGRRRRRGPRTAGPAGSGRA